MRELVWTDDARYDLDRIIDFIEARDEAASLRMRALIETGVERVQQFPFAFRLGRVPGTREAVLHPNYLLVFSVSEAAVRILSVLHARQQYP